MSINSGDVTLSSVVLTGGAVNNYNGAGIYLSFLSSGSITLDRSTVLGNSATGTGQGGGLFVNNDSTVSIVESTIRENFANIGGGISLNTAPAGLASSTISNTIISDNTATVQGGGLLAKGHTVDFLNTRFLGNLSAVGGAMHLSSDANVVIENLLAARNDASTGGVLFIDAATATIRGGSEPDQTVGANGQAQSGLIGNFASSGAVAELSNNAQLFISDAIMFGNENTVANISPSIIQIESGSSVHLDRVSIAANIDGISDNAAVTQESGSLSLTNSVFVLNFQPSVEILSGNATIQNVTFSQMITEAGDAGGLIVRAGASATVGNSIMANTQGIDDSGSEPVLVNGIDCLNQGTLILDQASIIEAGVCGQSRAIDPGVKEFDDSTPGGAFEALSQENLAVPLLGGSPAINSGDNTACPVVDYNTFRRSDGRCDVGAVEFDDSGFIVIPLQNSRVVVIPN